jgi:hypothetical protein
MVVYGFKRLIHTLVKDKWEANSRSASQEISRLLWNSKIYYRVHKSPPANPILYQIIPVHIHISHFFKIHFNIIFLIKLRFYMMHPTCSIQSLLNDLIILTLYRRQYKLRSS